jgi:hypothetical protein
MYKLRKTYGPWSTGTMVDEVLDNEVYYFMIGDLEIPIEYVVKSRNMTRYGPAINSRERRRREKATKKALGIDVS